MMYNDERLEELTYPDFEKSQNSNKNRKANLNYGFQCPYCESQFSQKYNMQIHVNLEHEDLFHSTNFSQILPITNIQSKKTENTESPNKNRKSSRSNFTQRFQCPYCDFHFSQKGSLKIHVSEKHEDLFSNTDFSNISILPINNIQKILKQFILQFLQLF